MYGSKPSLPPLATISRECGKLRYSVIFARLAFPAHLGHDRPGRLHPSQPSHRSAVKEAENVFRLPIKLSRYWRVDQTQPSSLSPQIRVRLCSIHLGRPVFRIILPFLSGVLPTPYKVPIWLFLRQHRHTQIVSLPIH
jgi:hypothetical protein